MTADSAIARWVVGGLFGASVAALLIAAALLAIEALS